MLFLVIVAIHIIVLPSQPCELSLLTALCTWVAYYSDTCAQTALCGISVGHPSRAVSKPSLLKISNTKSTQVSSNVCIASNYFLCFKTQFWDPLLNYFPRCHPQSDTIIDTHTKQVKKYDHEITTSSARYRPKLTVMLKNKDLTTLGFQKNS